MIILAIALLLALIVSLNIKSEYSTLISAILLLFFIITCGLTCSETSTNKPASESQPSYTPNFSAQTNNLYLTIRNNENIPWINSKISINTDYELTVPKLEPNKEVEIPLREFANDEGERFSGISHKAKTVCVEVNGGLNCLGRK